MKNKNNFENIVDNLNMPYQNNFAIIKRVCDYHNDCEPIMVSIICNCYNHSKYIEETILSFLNQLVDFNVEILVHDDCSQDNSQIIIERLSKAYPNIIFPLIEKENMYSKGYKITSMLQIPRARGKYVAFCEGDDCWVFDKKLYTQVHFLESNGDYSCSGHNSIVCVNDKRTLFCNETNEADISTIDALEWNKAKRIHYSSFVVRRELLNKEKPKYYSSFNHVGDRPLLIFLTENGRCKYFPFVGSEYRMFSTTSSWSYKNESDIKGQIAVRYNLSVFFTALSEHFKDNCVIYDECVALKNEYLYDSLFLNGDFNTILNNPDLNNYQKEKSFIHRIFFKIAKVCPPVHRAYVKWRLKR